MPYAEEDMPLKFVSTPSAPVNEQHLGPSPTRLMKMTTKIAISEAKPRNA